jgi:stage V sporulation protein B
MSTSTRRFLQDTLLSFLSLGMSTFVHFILRVFLAWYMGDGGDEALGLYTLSYTAYSFGVLLSAFGIGGAVAKYAAESGDDASRRGRYLLVGLVSSFFIGCLMWMALHFSSPLIAQRFWDMPEMTVLLQIVAVSFPFLALEKTTLGFLNGVRRMTLYAFVNIFQSILTIVLTVVLVLMGYGLKGAVVGLVVPIAVLSLISLFATRRDLRWPARGQSFPILKMLLWFGIFAAMGNSMYTLFYNIDKMLLARYVDEATVGVYSTASLLSNLVPLIPSAIQVISGPTIARYWGLSDIGSIQNLVNRTMKLTAVVIVPISFAGIVLSRDLIILFFRKEEFAAATVPLQILLAGFAFTGIFTSVATALSMTKWVQLGFIIGAVQVVANVALCILLIPRFGMNGASAAITASHTLGCLINLYLMQRLIKIRIDWKWFGRFMIFGALVVAGGLGLELVLNHYVCAVFGLAILTPITLRYFLTAGDREEIKKLASLAYERLASLKRPTS